MSSSPIVPILTAMDTAFRTIPISLLQRRAAGAGGRLASPPLSLLRHLPNGFGTRARKTSLFVSTVSTSSCPAVNTDSQHPHQTECGGTQPARISGILVTVFQSPVLSLACRGYSIYLPPPVMKELSENEVTTVVCDSSLRSAPA